MELCYIVTKIILITLTGLDYINKITLYCINGITLHYIMLTELHYISYWKYVMLHK